MIEVGVMKLLAADDAIKARISHQDHGVRIYLGRVPEKVPAKGGVLVVKKIAGERDYGLEDESPDRFTTLSVDAYDERPQDAESLIVLVEAVISGAAAISLVAPDAVAGLDHLIESSQIASERIEYQKPLGGTDDWRPRASRDFRIHHQ